MKSSRVKQRTIGAVLGISVVALSGCSTWNQLMGTEESVDYRSTVRADPLSIPPDLTQVNQDARYRAPEGIATFREYAQTEQQRRSVTDADRVTATCAGWSLINPLKTSTRALSNSGICRASPSEIKTRERV